MIYRNLGSSDIKVSEIALGCSAFHNISQSATDDFINYAYSNGINCIDLYTPDPDIHKRVGKAISPIRDNYVVQAHFCTIWEAGQYKVTRELEKVKKSFFSLLKNSGLSYVDIGMIHYVDSFETWNTILTNGIFDFVQECKKRGLIKLIGISSHNPDVARHILNYGIDVLMFSINPCYDLLPSSVDIYDMAKASSYEREALNLDPSRQALYTECLLKNISITVMKVFAGSELLDEKTSPVGKTLTPVQCLHYALTRPAVACVMCGVKSKKELDDCFYYEIANDREKDYTSALCSFPRISWSGHCLYCGHCAPCPKGIDVAMVTKLMNLAIAQGTDMAETEKEHYYALKAKGGDCIECGQCEKRCPFGVSIISNMKKAKNIFGC